MHAGCLVIHKPPNVPFHASADQPGLMQHIRSQQGQPHLPYTGPLYPVHRLDFICSGALVLGTSREAAGELVAAFRRKQVAKYYVALSDRKPARKMGSIVGDMQKGRRGSWMLARTRRDPAVTRFTSAAVLGAMEEEMGSAAAAAPYQHGGLQQAHTQQEGGQGGEEVGQQDGEQAQRGEQQQEQQQQARQQRRPALRAFLLKPETGRTHQLRVAMKSLGAPVLGDERYALKQAASQQDRGYLHCAALRFMLQGRPVQVVCPPQHGQHFLTPEFQQLFSSWFPPGVEMDAGIWFPESKLLRSEMAAVEEGAEAAAEPDWPGW